MFYVIREIHFNYGHRLMDHPGKCGHLHGHNARVQVEVSSEMLNHQNMVVDFAAVREGIGSWIDNTLDHKMILSEKDPLVSILRSADEPVVVMQENPTAEALARWIFQEARLRRLAVSRVTLWEADDCCAVYHE